MTTNTIFECYDWVSLKDITKEDIAELCGLNKVTFDYALPQYWIDSFVKKSNIDYNVVRHTCFAVYEESFGRIVTTCKEVAEKIKELHGNNDILI